MQPEVGAKEPRILEDILISESWYCGYTVVIGYLWLLKYVPIIYQQTTNGRKKFPSDRSNRYANNIQQNIIAPEKKISYTYINSSRDV